jgi:hypothetical protein
VLLVSARGVLRGKIEKHGKVGLGALGGYVQQYPVASIVVVFGLGLLVAKVLGR